MSRTDGFNKAAGKWAGTAEVYSGEGRFLGNGTDRRNVQEIGDNRIRIDLSFLGPFKFSGHYIIEDKKTERLYHGPVNVGYAEPLSNTLVDSNSYWAAIGMTQRFLLMVLPDGKRQVSMAQLSRGDQLIYTVIGENHKVDTAFESIPTLVNGTSYDLANDPTAGRGEILLHRNGSWAGKLSVLNENMDELPTHDYEEKVQVDGNQVEIQYAGFALDPEPATVKFTSNEYQAWSPPGDVVGSYNIIGGRASSGHFQHLCPFLRVWRREIVLHEGDAKAVIHIWYRGGQRVGAEFGILNFEAA
ncbi:MAG: hypothetical protein GY755_02335 [Chloroflexi bacterium]|nr:hypothetical protein [Chloroflexota bacterium]